MLFCQYKGAYGRNSLIDRLQRDFTPELDGYSIQHSLQHPPMPSTHCEPIGQSFEGEFEDLQFGKEDFCRRKIIQFKGALVE